MNDLVKTKLDSMANSDQTFLKFIRESEESFQIEHRSFERVSLEELDDYIDFLDYLWTK